MINTPLRCNTSDALPAIFMAVLEAGAETRSPTCCTNLCSPSTIELSIMDMPPTRGRIWITAKGDGKIATLGQKKYEIECVCTCFDVVGTAQTNAYHTGLKGPKVKPIFSHEAMPYLPLGSLRSRSLT